MRIRTRNDIRAAIAARDRLVRGFTQKINRERLVELRRARFSAREVAERHRLVLIVKVAKLRTEQVHPARVAKPSNTVRVNLISLVEKRNRKGSSSFI